MAEEPIREKAKTWVGEAKSDAKGILGMIQHRVNFGSPPLLSPASDAAISPTASLMAKQGRINRRRKLLGLATEPYSGFRP